jgi:hypothetical protein
MKLSHALSAVTDGAVKTASAPAPSPAPAPAASAPSGDAGERLKQALKEATAPEATKTAGAGSPVDDLTKLAADLSKAEHEALMKEAQSYGAAVCDGFMARAAQYKQAADQLPPVEVKTASVGQTDDTFEKFAAANADLVKEAAQQGYRAAADTIRDLHQRAFDAGWNAQVTQIHKLGCEAFVAGFKVANDLVAEAQR